jgi:murein tripeptide amidase MpaA
MARPNRRSHIIDKLRRNPEWNDNLAGSLIMSKFYYNMGIQDIEEKMEELSYDFPNFINVESIGQTFEGADIPVFTLADPSGKIPISERPAILLTGATHARELTTVSMVFYTMFRLLHGHMHDNQEIKNMLKEFTFYAMPALNVDGVKDVSNAWTKFGTFSQHRKNANNSYASQHQCNNDFTKVGVDLNRNWGFGFHTPMWVSDALMKATNGTFKKALNVHDPCSDVF